MTLSIPKTLEWRKEGFLRILDQTKLPLEKKYLNCKSKEEVWQAIKTLSVRGAPAIGIAAAYGLCVDLVTAEEKKVPFLKSRLLAAAQYLKTARPTAVNLFWAVDRMIHVSETFKHDDAALYQETLLKEALSIHMEDQMICETIGLTGSHFIKNGMNILTHCNAGAFATGGNGTALSVLYQAKKEGKQFTVYVDETRPLLQGSRITAFELTEAEIDTVLICDNMAGYLMKKGVIHLIITGADRIARNGDSANKIGTYTLAKMASQFHIPFYIAAPSSTFDLNTSSEDEIEIEERPKTEVTHFKGMPVSPSNVRVYNPAFDVTESSLIRGFFTEKGFIQPPFNVNIPKILGLRKKHHH
ncbi:MAG: S-methyl-5-thioribose-1-phosphate isomerase [Candidatus Aureabacteria bacterium]|nr:S-methyl-5-thioribose-1-phosphate isomerase [Candidatus Auribacterota bacterium]